MIEPTDNDLGRRVRLLSMPDEVGVIRGKCDCGQCRIPCIEVLYDGHISDWPTNPERLAWADEVLI